MTPSIRTTWKRLARFGRKAVRLIHRGLVAALLRLGEFLLRMRLTRASVAIYRSVVLHHDSVAPPKAYARLAKASRRTGRLRSADEALAAGLSRFGEVASLVAESAELARRRGDWGVAARRWRRVLELCEMAGIPPLSDAGIRLEEARAELERPGRRVYVARVVPDVSYGFVVESDLVSDRERRELLELAMERYRGAVAALVPNLQVREWNLSETRTHTFAPDSVGAVQHAVYCRLVLERAASRSTEQRRSCLIGVKLPGHVKSFLEEALESSGVEFSAHPHMRRRVPLASSTVCGERYVADRLGSPRARHMHERFWVLTYLISNATIGSKVRQRVRRIAKAARGRSVAWVHIKSRIQSLDRPIDSGGYLSWRAPAIVGDSGRIDALIPFVDLPFGRRIGPKHRHQLASAMVRQLDLRTTPSGAVSLETQVPALVSVRLAIRARREAAEIARRLKALESSTSDAERRYLARVVRKRIDWGTLLVAHMLRAGAQHLSGLLVPLVVYQSDAITKEARIWTGVLRNGGIPVVYIGDRVLTRFRASNLPLSGACFDPGDPCLPNSFVVFDDVSYATLVGAGIPSERIWKLPRSGAGRSNTADDVPPEQGALSLYLQDYKDGMIEMISAAAEAGSRAGFSRLVLRPHPHFPLSGASRRVLESSPWRGIDVAVSTGAADDAARGKVALSGFSTALVARHLEGTPVIWLAHVCLNEWLLHPFTSRLGVRVESQEELEKHLRVFRGTSSVSAIGGNGVLTRTSSSASAKEVFDRMLEEIDATQG